MQGYLFCTYTLFKIRVLPALRLQQAIGDIQFHHLVHEDCKQGCCAGLLQPTAFSQTNAASRITNNFVFILLATQDFFVRISSPGIFLSLVLCTSSRGVPQHPFFTTLHQQLLQPRSQSPARKTAILSPSESLCSKTIMALLSAHTARSRAGSLLRGYTTSRTSIVRDVTCTPTSNNTFTSRLLSHKLTQATRPFSQLLTTSRPPPRLPAVSASQQHR